VEGHDEQSLLYNFLDELLFVFSTELLVCCELTVLTLDRATWKIRAFAYAPYQTYYLPIT
jgi:SHS2 domain-containing protein